MSLMKAYGVALPQTELPRRIGIGSTSGSD